MPRWASSRESSHRFAALTPRARERGQRMPPERRENDLRWILLLRHQDTCKRRLLLWEVCMCMCSFGIAFLLRLNKHHWGISWAFWIIFPMTSNTEKPFFRPRFSVPLPADLQRGHGENYPHCTNSLQDKHSETLRLEREKRYVNPHSYIISITLIDLEESLWTTRKATSLSQRSMNFTRL